MKRISKRGSSGDELDVWRRRSGVPQRREAKPWRKNRRRRRCHSPARLEVEEGWKDLFVKCEKFRGLGVN